MAAIATLVLVTIGVAYLAVVDRVARSFVAGAPVGLATLAAPFRDALRDLMKERRPTERPDPVMWLGAPILLVTLVFAALTVMPLSGEAVGSDLSVGVVFFTAMFALIMVAAWAAGWGPNSKYPLIAGYRFIGLMLAYEMPFAITIIAVALPAESLALGKIVAWQQAHVWNVILQPVGFLIYLVSALAVAFSGPFALLASKDLAGGVELELSGGPRLLWRFGHRALLLSTAAFAVPLFLGGGAGPFLPPEVWTVLKVLFVAGTLALTGHLMPLVRLDWFMKTAWVVLIPLALVNLFLVGAVALLFPAWFGSGG